MIRLNVGGNEYITAAGDTFSVDQAHAPGNFGYIGGTEKDFDHAVAGTNDDSLFLNLRFSDSALATCSIIYRKGFMLLIYTLLTLTLVV